MLLQAPPENPAKKSSLEARYPLVANELQDVKRSLLDILKPEAAILAENLQLSLSNTGKLFRPALLLLTSKACQASEITSQDIETAAVAELIHTATLIHDDVLDDAELRRGEPTLKTLRGNKIAVLSGDYLLAQASLKLSKLNNCKLVSIYAHVLSDLCDGEILQLQQQGNCLMDWSQYLRKTQCKTASLFEACTESAGVIHQQSDAIIEQLKAYGRHLGLAFQLADDLLDFTSTAEALGKPALEDLRQGIVTAPVILALQKTQGQERQKLETLIRAVFEDSTKVLPLLETLNDLNAITQTRDLALEHSEKAVQALACLPDSPYKTALADLATHAVDRVS